MKVDFLDHASYQKFAESVKDWLIRDCDFQDDLEDDIADSIVERHLRELSAAVVDRLIERIIQKHGG